MKNKKLSARAQGQDAFASEDEAEMIHICRYGAFCSMGDHGRCRNTGLLHHHLVEA
jgi:hypothetical protein